MKIEQRGVVITEVPGFESITVQAIEPGQASILLQPAYSFDHPWAYSLEELTAMRDALTEALKHAALITGLRTDRPALARIRRIWEKDDPEPDHGTRLEDKDGDVWIWDVVEERWRHQSLIYTWPNLAFHYGPFTEVLS